MQANCLCITTHNCPLAQQTKNYSSDGKKYNHYTLKHLKLKKLNIINSLSHGHQQADTPKEKPIHMRKEDI